MIFNTTAEMIFNKNSNKNPVITISYQLSTFTNMYVVFNKKNVITHQWYSTGLEVMRAPGVSWGQKSPSGSRGRASVGVQASHNLPLTNAFSSQYRTLIQ